MIDQIRPVFAPIGGLGLGREHWLMPSNLAKARGAQCLLMCLDGEEIVLDFEGTIIEMKSPGQTGSLAKLSYSEISKPYLRYEGGAR